MITSRQNQWIARVRQALRKPRDEIVIEGPKQVNDAITRGMAPKVVLSSREISEPGEFLLISEELADWIGDTRTSQGVFGLFARPGYEFSNLEGERQFIIALDGVQDPGNVGTIIRLASAFEASGVIGLPGTADFWGARVIRASAGEILRMPVVRMEHQTFLDVVAKKKLSIYSAQASGEEQTVPSRDVVVVFGSEGEGVSRSISEAGRSFSIAMNGAVESINVASAAAITLQQTWKSWTETRR